MYKRMLIAVITVLALLMLTVSAAMAAQGQITEVNPSGIGVAKAAHGSANPPGLQNAPGLKKNAVGQMLLGNSPTTDDGASTAP